MRLNYDNLIKFTMINFNVNKGIAKNVLENLKCKTWNKYPHYCGVIENTGFWVVWIDEKKETSDLIYYLNNETHFGDLQNDFDLEQLGFNVEESDPLPFIADNYKCSL